MPNYSFKCPNGHEFDRIVRLADFDKPQACAECGETAERTITKAPGQAFKGGGWTPKFS